MKSKIFIALFLFFAAGCARLYAEDVPTWHDHLKEIGILTGYGASRLIGQGPYRVVPFYVQLGVDMDKMQLGYCDWVEKAAKTFFHKDFRPQGYTEFVVEPFLSDVVGPNSNMEVGLVLLSRFAYPVTPHIHPYLFGGGGVMYGTQHVHYQATQWNFTPQLGAGVSFFLKDDLALKVEYRRRHFSNANIKTPNHGVNANLVLMGISWFFS